MCGGGGGIGKLVGQGVNALFLGTTDAVGLTGEGSMFEPSGELIDNSVQNATQEKSVSTDVQSARDDEKRRRAAAAGLSSTILGGSTTTGTTATKTLLGS